MNPFARSAKPKPAAKVTLTPLIVSFVPDKSGGIVGRGGTIHGVRRPAFGLRLAPPKIFPQRRAKPALLLRFVRGFGVFTHAGRVRPPVAARKALIVKSKVRPHPPEPHRQAPCPVLDCVG